MKKKTTKKNTHTLIMSSMLALVLAPGGAGCVAVDPSAPSLEAYAIEDGGSKKKPEEDAGTPHYSEPRTQGYWKNHPEQWPVNALMLGGRMYPQAQLLLLLDTPPRGDASVILARQLIAAMLNESSGAPPCAAIVDAQAWLRQNDPGQPLPYGVPTWTTAGSDATRLAGILDAYNQGRGFCD
jgi:hypothetical protein